jgi:hypothetical protein
MWLPWLFLGIAVASDKEDIFDLSDPLTKLKLVEALRSIGDYEQAVKVLGTPENIDQYLRIIVPLFPEARLWWTVDPGMKPFIDQCNREIGRMVNEGQFELTYYNLAPCGILKETPKDTIQGQLLVPAPGRDENGHRIFPGSLHRADSFSDCQRTIGESARVGPQLRGVLPQAQWAFIHHVEFNPFHPRIELEPFYHRFSQALWFIFTSTEKPRKIINKSGNFYEATPMESTDRPCYHRKTAIQMLVQYADLHGLKVPEDLMTEFEKIQKRKKIDLRRQPPTTMK